MTADERQLASIPDEAPRGPQHWKRWLHVALTLCACILVVGYGLTLGDSFNIQLTGIVGQAVYVVLYFVESTAGCEVFMVVGFVLAVRVGRQNPAFTRGHPGYRKSFVWGSRLALGGVVPLAIGCFWFGWYFPGLLEGWRPANPELVGGIALLGAALVLLCLGIVLLCVAFIGVIGPWAGSVVRGPSGT
jgi:hypothetical protein